MLLVEEGYDQKIAHKWPFKGETLDPSKESRAGQSLIYISIITETGERWEGGALVCLVVRSSERRSDPPPG